MELSYESELRFALIPESINQGKPVIQQPDSQMFIFPL